MLIILVKQSYSGINHEQDDDRENICCLHYPLEGLAVVVNRVTCSISVPGSIIYVHICHPRGALPAPGLAGCPVGRGE